MATAWTRLNKRDPARRERTRRAKTLCVMLVLGATWYTLGRGAGVRGFTLSLLSLAAVWWFSVFLHELGHVAAAKLVGLVPTLMLVGGGPSLVRREVLGMAWDLGCLPGGGLTVIASPRLQRHLKWRLFAAYLGGPLVSCWLLLLGSVVFARDWEQFRAGTDVWLKPGSALVLVTGLELVVNLIPVRSSSDGTLLGSDLVQILRLPRRDEGAMMARLIESAAGDRISRLYVLRQYQAALDEGRRQLASDPKRWMIRAQVAEMLIHAGRYAEAAKEYYVLLDDPALSEKEVPPLVSALVANNYAWACYMQRDPALLAAADKWSSKAIAEAPNHPSVLGTRGAVLVERGRLSQGRKLLRSALRRERDGWSRATILACLAVASARNAKPGSARRLLLQARRMDPDSELLSRVEEELTARR